MAGLRHCTLAALAATALIAGACNSKKSADDMPAKLGDNAMEELAEVYKYIRDSKLAVPRKVEDFEEYEASLPTAYPKIQSGEFVIAWGVGLGSGTSVLAYEKEAGGKGGLVLLQNGEVRTVTAAEFGTLAKAR